MAMRMTNLPEVRGHFGKGRNAFSKGEGKKILDEAAWEVAKQQQYILFQKVKRWSGRLAGSINIKRRGLKAAIGPDKRKASRRGYSYAQYIESGGGAFKGYWYVRDSAKGIDKKFKGKIKAVVNNLNNQA